MAPTGRRSQPPCVVGIGHKIGRRSGAGGRIRSLLRSLSRSTRRLVGIFREVPHGEGRAPIREGWAGPIDHPGTGVAEPAGRDWRELAAAVPALWHTWGVRYRPVGPALGHPYRCVGPALARPIGRWRARPAHPIALGRAASMCLRRRTTAGARGVGLDHAGDNRGAISPKFRLTSGGFAGTVCVRTDANSCPTRDRAFPGRPRTPLRGVIRSWAFLRRRLAAERSHGGRCAVRGRRVGTRTPLSHPGVHLG